MNGKQGIVVYWMIQTNVEPEIGKPVTGWLAPENGIETSEVVDIHQQDAKTFMVLTASGSKYVVVVNPQERHSWAQRAEIARKAQQDSAPAEWVDWE